MPLIDMLATTLGRRDEVPNQELARKIAKKKDKKAVAELILLLKHKDKNIQADSIKVLYEIGETNPELISTYDKVFLDLLENKNNRLIWGAMSALDCIASVNPNGIYKNLIRILDAADKGTVITNDRAMNILIKISVEKNYAVKASILILDKLKSCPTNQLPMYAENSSHLFTDKNKKEFASVLSKRLGDVEKESKRKRIEKVIKKLDQANAKRQTLNAKR